MIQHKFRISNFGIQIVCLFLFIVLSACAVPDHQSLTEIPGYNREAANENWPPIQELHIQFRVINRALGVLHDMKAEVSDKQIDAMAVQIDAYYFHSSAATIELFYGDYPASRVSTGKAETALRALGKIVREVIEANNV